MFAFSNGARTLMSRESVEPGLRFVALAFVLVALIGWPGSIRPAWGQEAKAQSSLNLIGDPLELQIKKDEEELPAQVIVRNDSARSTDLRFSAVLRDNDDKWFKEVSIDSPSTQVEPYSITPIDLKIDKAQFESPTMPLKGFLVVSGAPETTNGEGARIAPGTIPLTVSKPKVLPSKVVGMSPLNLLVSVPFVFSFLVVIFCSRKVFANSVVNLSRADLRREPTLRKLNLLSTLGSELTLDFSKSWASLLTVGTAIVAAVASAQGAQVFPSERPYIAQQQTAGLALFFAAMVVFGPTIYNLLRRQRAIADPAPPAYSYRVEEPTGRLVYVLKSPSSAKPAGANAEPQLQSYVLTYLLSSALTLGALLGQLAVAGFLIYQIDTAIPDLGQTLLIGAIAVIEVLAIIYISYTVYVAVKDKGRRREGLQQVRPDLFDDHYTNEQRQVAP
jgi:hypothetical protein